MYKESIITRINYNERLKGLLCTAVTVIAVSSVKIIDKSPELYATYPVLFGRMYDFSQPLLYASTLKAFMNIKSRTGLTASAIAYPSLLELLQKLKIIEGTFDPGDLVSFALGGTTFYLFDLAAKKLHDSGLTDPIYNALGIQKRYS